MRLWVGTPTKQNLRFLGRWKFVGVETTGDVGGFGANTELNDVTISSGLFQMSAYQLLDGEPPKSVLPNSRIEPSLVSLDLTVKQPQLSLGETNIPISKSATIGDFRQLLHKDDYVRDIYGRVIPHGFPLQLLSGLRFSLVGKFYRVDITANPGVLLWLKVACGWIPTLYWDDCPFDRLSDVEHFVNTYEHLTLEEALKPSCKIRVRLASRYLLSFRDLSYRSPIFEQMAKPNETDVDATRKLLREGCQLVRHLIN